MTHLTITQGSTAETVSTTLIKKLYDVAISIPEPLQGETDNAQISGHISVGTSYRNQVEYLAGTIMYKGTGEQGNNPHGRFQNLQIDVTNTYYVEFVDSAVESVLINAGLGDGTGITENDAAAATFGSPTVTFRNNTSITSFDEFGKFTYVNQHGKQNLFYGCSNLTSIDLTQLTTTAESEFRGIGITILNAPLLSNFTGSNVFNECTNLNTIQSFGSITSIPQLAFRGCTSLSTIPSLDDITNFGQGCFNGCSNLTATVNLTNVANIGQNAFKNTKIQVTGTPSANINIGGAAFQQCSNLTSFDFSNITTLNDSVFYESGLSGTLSIPNLTGVLRGAEFYKCTGLTSITNLGSITSITDSPYTVGGIKIGSFHGCTGLTSITIPSTVTKIGESAFTDCTSLSQVNCSWQNVIEVGQNAFNNHANWNFIVNLSNLTTLGKEAFGGYRSSKRIRQLYIPKIVNTNSDSYYQSYVYYRGTFTGINADIIYLRDLQSLHPGDFAYTTCTALVINNTTPPVWKNRNDLTDEETTDSTHTKDKVFSYSAITNIYVPDSAVTTYQTDANWSSVANKIQPLSNLTKVATEADLQANQVALIEAYM